jgi:hypothetical protein
MSESLDENYRYFEQTIDENIIFCLRIVIGFMYILQANPILLYDTIG